MGPIQVARRSDMDMNGHVNNVTYFAWVLETVPRDIYDGCHLYQVNKGCKKGCRRRSSRACPGGRCLCRSCQAFASVARGRNRAHAAVPPYLTLSPTCLRLPAMLNVCLPADGD